MKNLFLSFLITSTLLTPLCAEASTININKNVAQITTVENSYNDEYICIFNKMKDAMSSKISLENVDLAFVDKMIPHHEGAIEMSKAVIKYGCNSEVKKIAEHIISSQNTQLPLMRNMKCKFEKESPSKGKVWKEYISAYDKVKDTMFKDMEGVKPTNNADITFLEQMIPHHEGAVNMSKNILKYTSDPELKKLATNIVNSQDSGILKMKELLKTIKSQ